MRDTARQIERILRMDYRTFINSAYIQQGKADEFTKQTVADRKKILADILDLSRYDALEQKARDRRNDADVRVTELTREIELSENELSQEDEWKSQLKEAKTEREGLEAELSKAEEKVRDLQTRQADLDAKSKRVKEIEAQVTGLWTEVRNLDSQRIDQERRVARGREVLTDKDRILEGIARLKETRERITRLDSRLEELRKLEHEKSRIEQGIAAEKHRIEADRSSASREASELQTRLDAAAEITKDIESLRNDVSKLDQIASRRNTVQAELSAMSDHWGGLKARHDHLAEALTDLREKLELISQPGAECPLCKMELGHEKHERIIADYQHQIKDTEGQLRQVKADGIKAKHSRDLAQSDLDVFEKALNKGLDMRNRLARAEHILSQAEESRKAEPRLRERLDDLGKKLESNDYAQDIRTQVKEIGTRIDGLQYDGSEHSTLKAEVAGLQQFETLAATLKTAAENLPADESNLGSIVDLIETRRKTIADCEQSVRELQAAITDLPAVVSELTQASALLRALRENDRDLIGRIARLEQSVERCKTLRKQTAARRKELEQAKKDRLVYTDLVAAFGKKGVQALIIENAIPEIQDEANSLLARMTDNAMQVSFETVRDKKTGGTAETLDIKISDEMGTRSYELYSGGEAFRVNFALRIALSKLLARRAGARLQTLIIDEGFGTQDAKGRERLVDAINSIQEDFEKILVITHIDELKDAFPTRIEVTKDASGSQIAVA
jgi:exonuclease SbcC